MAGGRKVPLNTPKNGLESSEHYRKDTLGLRLVHLSRSRFIPRGQNVEFRAETKLKFYAVSKKFGGRDRDRTCDLMLAKHALSQLSYTPTVITILEHLPPFENCERTPCCPLVFVCGPFDAHARSN